MMFSNLLYKQSIRRRFLSLGNCRVSGRCSSSTSRITYEFENSVNDENLHVKRHTAAHILAMAVQTLIPDAQATIGPSIEHGYDVFIFLFRHVSGFIFSILHDHRFYYDFYFPTKQIADKDLDSVKAIMRKIIKNKYGIHREMVSVQEARYFNLPVCVLISCGL